MNDIEFQIVPALPQVDVQKETVFCADYILAARGDLSRLDNVKLWLEENIGYDDEVRYTIDFNYWAGIERLYITIEENYWNENTCQYWQCHFDKTERGWKFHGYHTHIGMVSVVVDAIQDLHATMMREPAGASL